MADRAGIVTASLLALSVLGGGTDPGSRRAGRRSRDGLRRRRQPASGASSTAVSAGKKVGFFEWLRNDDTSNISQLYLNAPAPTPTRDLAGAELDDQGRGPAPRSGNRRLPAATPLTVPFGSPELRATPSTSSLAFTTPSTLADGATRGPVAASFNATGTPPREESTATATSKALDDSRSLITQRTATPTGDFNLAPDRPHRSPTTRRSRTTEPAGDVRHDQTPSRSARRLVKPGVDDCRATRP